MRFRAFPRMVVVMATSVLPVCAMSQTDTIARNTHELQEVEIVSSRQKAAMRSSVPLQSMSYEQLFQLGTTSIADALRHISGVNVRDYGGAGGMKTASIRGIGSRHTAVIYDGLALSDCQTGEIDLARYSIDNAKWLSLVVGDADNIFKPARNSASAATIIIESRGWFLPTESDKQLRATMRSGSWGMLNPSVFYRQRVNKKLAFSASSEFIHADNDYTFTLKNVDLKTKERRKNSRMNSFHAETNAFYMPNSVSRLAAKAYFYDNCRRLPGIVRYYTDENDERLHEQNAFAQARFTTQLAENFTFMLNGKYNWAMSDYRNHTPGTTFSDAKYWQREAYSSASLLFTPREWLSVNYSSDYIFNALHSTLSTYQRPRRNSFLQTLSAKFETKRITATATLLASIYRNRAESGETPADVERLSPSVSLSFRPFERENLYFRLMFKDIFRMPTFNELYYYHIGNAVIQPEKARQFNIGATWQSRSTRRFSTMLTADVYINKVEDKIIAVPFNMFVWRMMNIGRARIIGLDANIDAKYAINRQQTLQLSANYTLQKAQNRTNKASEQYNYQLAYTPKHAFGTTATWLNQWANLSVSIDGQTARWTTNEHAQGTRLAGFAEADVAIWRTFPLKKASLTLKMAMQNVLNKQYELVAHYPMPGRSWSISATIDI